MLTDVKVRTAKPGPRPYKLPDGMGLHLFITPAGTRSWRLRYQKDGRERLITLGSYPEMSLREARDARDDARRRLRDGTPAVEAPKATLAEVTARWHAANSNRWKPHHAADVLHGLRAEILGSLGARPIQDVSAPDLLAELRRVEERSPDIAHRLRGRLEAVFAFAIGEGSATLNPAAMLAKAMKPRDAGGHRPAVATIEEARAVLVKVEAMPAHPVTRLALRFLALTAARPGEVGGMTWEELDGETWRIPAERMKMKREHIVPLSRQAAATIEEVRPFSRRRQNVFPSPIRDREGLSANALNVLLRRAGLYGVHVPHGWRATFSTVMNERFPADRAVIDLMLAHAPADAVEAAYNRAQHLPRRRELAQLWADLLVG